MHGNERPTPDRENIPDLRQENLINQASSSERQSVALRQPLAVRIETLVKHPEIQEDIVWMQAQLERRGADASWHLRHLKEQDPEILEELVRRIKDRLNHTPNFLKQFTDLPIVDIPAHAMDWWESAEEKGWLKLVLRAYRDMLLGQARTRQQMSKVRTLISSLPLENQRGLMNSLKQLGKIQTEDPQEETFIKALLEVPGTAEQSDITNQTRPERASQDPRRGKGHTFLRQIDMYWHD